MDVRAAIDGLNLRLSRAQSAYQDYEHHGNEYDWDSVKWSIETAFLQLLVLTEALSLPLLREQVRLMFETARVAGFGQTEDDPLGEAFLSWPSKIRQYANAIAATYGVVTSTTITKELVFLLSDYVR